jgi:hypothetical protein
LKYSQVSTALGAVSWMVIVVTPLLVVATGRSAPIHSFEFGSSLLGLLGSAVLGSGHRPGAWPDAPWLSPLPIRLAAAAAAARATAWTVNMPRSAVAAVAIAVCDCCASVAACWEP